MRNEHDSCFKLECIVGIDYAKNEKDFTHAIVCFINNRNQVICIAHFDDTDAIGKLVITEMIGMKHKMKRRNKDE